MNTLELYEAKKQKLIEEFRLAKKEGRSVGLGKKTSNLFRERKQNKTRKINVRDFNRVISVDSEHLIAEVEGMTKYEDFVRETLKYGLLPTVVPELKSITVGGATTGIGIESSSFRYGFVHETVMEMEILTGQSEVVVCNAHNKHKDLFFGFPNSYGTLGYALKLKVKLVPVKKNVQLTHTRFHDAKSFFKELERICEEGRAKKNAVDFIDGTVFSPEELYITRGTFSDRPQKPSDYKFMNIFYQSIRHKKNDTLTPHDYIWRWDTDWFWCSKHYFMQNKMMRFLFGKFALKSTFYWKIGKWVNNIGLGEKLQKIMSRGKKLEWIIQDVEIPIENAENFFDFFFQEIGIKPVWICPVQAYNSKVHYDLYRTDSRKLYINFGFWDGKITDREDNYYNKLIEAKVQELGGKKSLYSTSYYSKEQFWKLYNKEAYERLKAKYDPEGVLKDLYEKCVRGR
jgi:FAD/FMN-containing dehydrogenase